MKTFGENNEETYQFIWNAETGVDSASVWHWVVFNILEILEHVSPRQIRIDAWKPISQDYHHFCFCQNVWQYVHNLCVLGCFHSISLLHLDHLSTLLVIVYYDVKSLTKVNLLSFTILLSCTTSIELFKEAIVDTMIECFRITGQWLRFVFGLHFHHLYIYLTVVICWRSYGFMFFQKHKTLSTQASYGFSQQIRSYGRNTIISISSWIWSNLHTSSLHSLKIFSWTHSVVIVVVGWN